MSGKLVSVACFVCPDVKTMLNCALSLDKGCEKYLDHVEELVDEECLKAWELGMLPNGLWQWRDGEEEEVSEWEDLTDFHTFCLVWDRFHTLHVEDAIPWDACAGNYDYYSN